MYVWGDAMRLVVIESPYAGDVERNVAYAKKCMLHSIRLGEAPFLSHLLYTQVLDDQVPEERKLGIEAGLAWAKKSLTRAVYVDHGISDGMRAGIRQHVTNEKIRATSLWVMYERPWISGPLENPSTVVNLLVAFDVQIRSLHRDVTREDRFEVAQTIKEALLEKKREPAYET